MEHFLEVVEYFGTHADAFVERSSADRTNHEFLEADGSVGVSATVDDVHHGHGQHVGVAAADVFVEGQAEVVGSGLGNGERYTEDGVSAEVRLGFGTVESEHCFVDGNLVEGIHALESFGYGAVNVGYSLEHTLAHVAALVAVAELESFVFAGRCTGGHAGATESA